MARDQKVGSQRAQTAASASPFQRLGWLAAYVVAYFFCFPHPGGSAASGADAVVDLGPLLAWFAPALLLLGLRGLSPRRAAVAAFLATWAAHSVVVHWIYVVTVEHGAAHPVLGVLAPIGLSLYPAVPGALFGAAVGWLAQRRSGSPLLVAILWTALDHGRSFALSGWPWATLGYAHHENPWLLGLASVTGVYGLSFVSVAVAASGLELGVAWRARRPAPASAWLALGVAGVLVLVGATRAAPVFPGADGGGDVVRVAALQGNIDQGEKWSRARADSIWQRYADLTREAASLGAELVLWPETAFPGLMELDADRREQLAALARQTQVALVVGGVGVSMDASGSRIESYYDSAFVVDAQGLVADRYDKTHLVPFGEYLPLRALLGRLVRAVATGVATGDVSAGESVRAVDVHLPARGGKPQRVVRVGVPICYELLFPDLMRRFAGDGAQLLLAITNDAWYGRTGAPYQFLAMTAMRAAESGVATMRAANTGVSAAIEADGQILSGLGQAGLGETRPGKTGRAGRTAIFQRALVVADMPLRPSGAAATFYVRNGDVFAISCWLILMLRFVWAAKRGPSGSQPESEA